ncbi:MAG: hypothetical protein R3254_07645, partial [Thiomicrorhabdus sp.]|nr:hypothetical protein [Thiomicrorhabdus sp.]
EINLELENMGFRFSSRDPVYEEYLKARYQKESGFEGVAEKKAEFISSEQKRSQARELIKAAMARIKGEGDAAD